MSPGKTVSSIRRALKEAARLSYRTGIFYIHKRWELPHILNAKGLLGEGAEIGVQQGDFSELILESWRGRKLYSIDPWKEFSREEYRDAANVKQAEHDHFFRETQDKLARFGDRSCIMRSTSQEAVSEFTDAQLDFVYVDAQHHYDAVKEDIRLWLPKVRPGGLLAGHDYIDGVLDGSEYGVKSAVDECVAGRKCRLLVSRADSPPSWFIFL
jgi:hypothetical protein